MAVKKAEKKADKKEEKKAKEIRQSAWEKYDKKALDACFASILGESIWAQRMFSPSAIGFLPITKSAIALPIFDI